MMLKDYIKSNTAIRSSIFSKNFYLRIKEVKPRIIKNLSHAYVIEISLDNSGNVLNLYLVEWIQRNYQHKQFEFYVL